jgi:hypothetical protein
MPNQPDSIETLIEKARRALHLGPNDVEVRVLPALDALARSHAIVQGVTATADRLNSATHPLSLAIAGELLGILNGWIPPAAPTGEPTASAIAHPEERHGWRVLAKCDCSSWLADGHHESGCPNEPPTEARGDEARERAIQLLTILTSGVSNPHQRERAEQTIDAILGAINEHRAK